MSYRLYNESLDEYYLGGVYPKTNKVGKLWNKLNHVKSAIHCKYGWWFNAVETVGKIINGKYEYKKEPNKLLSLGDAEFYLHIEQINLKQREHYRKNEYYKKYDHFWNYDYLKENPTVLIARNKFKSLNINPEELVKYKSLCIIPDDIWLIEYNDKDFSEIKRIKAKELFGDLI